MIKYKTVDEFLSGQDPDNLSQINKLRELILQTEPKLTENLKWNAPNYVFDGQDRITFNLMNKQNQVKLILHMGTAIKEDKNADPILLNDEGIIEWSSNIRGIISFKDMADIDSKKEKITKVINDWLAIKTKR